MCNTVKNNFYLPQKLVIAPQKLAIAPQKLVIVPQKLAIGHFLYRRKALKNKGF
ncbi:hypothetical protein [Methanobrevibacter sp.]|uniref:hypothetical protein n=1 Tax=Methanobrevibacter sp. TaxID=66852 RepID=UPI00386A08A7